MASRKYTADQLLALKGSKREMSMEKTLFETAKDSQVLSHIMNHRVRYRRGLPSLSRAANAEARKSSSTESETMPTVKTQAPPQLPEQAFVTNVATVGTNQLDGQGVRQLDGQDAEPEIQAPEPVSQRPTLPDQKRKGFEQFYEAVRSPTHVRVTAGGRIVPNTLDPSHSSPTGKGSKERLAENNGQLPFGQAQAQAPNMPFLPGHPMMAPIQPGMPSMSMPMHPGYLMTPPFGGQWFFPPHPMMPMGMPFPGPIMGPLGPVYHQQPPPTPLTAGIPQTAPTPTPISGDAASDQYLSSIRPSIITKNQLAGLRTSLKKAEAQLAYNRHQIDERHMEEYARQLRGDIQHFELKLKGELAREAGNNSGREYSAEKTEDSADTKTKSDSDDKPKSRKREKVKLTVDTSFKPSLLPSAALAPVFQPQAESSREPSVSIQRKTVEDKPKDTLNGGRYHGLIPANLEESRYLSMPPTPADDAFSNFARDNAGLGLPYLVGEVPFGLDPSPDLRDYIYHRSLTQDEEMAKHLFWTDAPVHLRKKFPKFDGKDFYPVSPEKRPRPEGNVIEKLPTGRPEKDYGFSLPAATDLDPFAPLEPYRNVLKTRTVSARERDQKRATKSDNVTSPMKPRSGNKLRPVAYFNSQGVESKDSSGSSDQVGETESERAYFNSCVRAWSERVTATATTLPGAVTSENAQGYLPQYSVGHAAASLSPAIVKAAGQPARLSPAKANDNDNLHAALSRLAVSADGRPENQPPHRSIQIK